ncbi:translation initiation factor IF-3 [Fodinisporobacter ferrooxydans]|uniref:Translation initiation factor IF-3 n=1 Tax=Fodinisporobacter ferrooxydans TaxID=2901836 RepID=A0ABY4CQE7_9BACL|nr:translation initiation factor IF-3 [Alicyclobacillaceae bacterium MYW30-H2]
MIDVNGDQLGIVAFREALRIASEKNLDLVNVAPTAKPPVCRIMDYGKFKYEQSKREKESRKNQKVISIKEIRMTPNIEEHDFETKLRNVMKFLEAGDKVKIAVRFRGREITHTAIGQSVLERMAKAVEEISMVERSPKLEGRQMIMILSPKQS